MSALAAVALTRPLMRHGSLATAPYNPEIGQQRALENAPTLERKTKTLIKDSEKVGMGDPPPEVLEDLKWMVKLDKQIHRNQPWGERYRILAALYDERNGTSFSDFKPQTEGEAEAAYHELRPQLYPWFRQWDSDVSDALQRRALAQPVRG